MDATRAPLPLTLGGIERLIHPLDLEDLGEVINLIGAKTIKAAHIAAQSTPDIKLKSAMIAGAYAYAGQVHLMGREMIGYMASFEGLVTMLHLSIAKGDPTFTKQDAMNSLSNVEDQITFTEAINSMIPEGEGGSPDPKGSKGEAK